VRGARSRPSTYGTAVLAVALSTAVAFLTSPYFAPSNLVMIYLLGVAFVAIRAHRGPAVLASILSVAAFDFFFVPPRFTFAVNDTQYVVTFVVMLGVALVISDLATRVHMQADIVRQRERRTAVLYSLSRELAATPATEDIASAAARHVSDAFSAPATVLLPRFDGRLVPLSGRQAAFTLTPRDEAVARWVLEHGRMAGMGTDTLPGAGALFLPVAGTRGPVAVLGIRPPGTDAPSPDSVHLLEALASQTAAALERARLAEEAQSARITAETEKLRSTLLSSVSHDLRTPLASITGSASTLLDPDASLPPSAHRDLIVTIHEEADRLNRLVANLLDMTRLESGAVQVKKEWLTVEEIVGAALTRLEPRLARRPVTTDLPQDLPLVALDGVLIEQVLVNLIENALKYTPDETPIEISARAGPAAVTVEVADRGPGIPEGAFESIFDKFHRLQPGARPGGVGLGLTICKAIVTAHGGKIWVENRPGGGATFRFTLPRDATPPSMAGDKMAGDKPAAEV
jgi:two-component system sensor histidine kinase KdpD